MSYFDGFVTPVWPGKREEYRTMAEKTAAMFVEHGALQVVEGFADDVPHGKQTDFWRAVEAVDEEGLVLSWVVWPSKEVRDAGWAKVMEDPRMKSLGELPFDGKRLIYGGFETIVDVKG
jgi:uncharacterized protein YbaA (DUF1428 family)